MKDNWEQMAMGQAEMRKVERMKEGKQWEL